MKEKFDDDPMNFWKPHQVSKLQKLFRIAKTIYCIPSSSTSSERVTDFFFIAQLSLSKRNLAGRRDHKKYANHEIEVIVGSWLRMLRMQGL